MVGPLVLLKMLHCRRMNARKTNLEDEPPEPEPPSEGPSHKSLSKRKSSPIKVMKKEKEESVCRVCLQEGNIPIFGDDCLEKEDISEALNSFGGIDVRIDDPHPKFLCQSCNSLLQGAILFRKTAQQSDEVLKYPPGDNDNSMDYSDDDLPLIDTEEKVKKQENHCKRCDIKYDSFKELEEHRLSDEHENMRRVCPYCHKSYAPLYYKKHLTLHTKDASYVCDVCGKNFIMQGHFTRHRLTHFYKLPFKCSLCPYKGRFRESLKMHMRSHTGEKPYQCSECPSRFINKSNLNKHMLTHKEEPDFKCDSCGRRFYTKREVELHYKVDHAGVKDHVCKVCGKAFGYRKQMMKHELKVHKRAKLRSGRMPLYIKVERMQQQGQNIATEN